jgi:hypothetical protein
MVAPGIHWSARAQNHQAIMPYLRMANSETTASIRRACPLSSIVLLAEAVHQDCKMSETHANYSKRRHIPFVEPLHFILVCLQELVIGKVVRTKLGGNAEILRRRFSLPQVCDELDSVGILQLRSSNKQHVQRSQQRPELARRCGSATLLFFGDCIWKPPCQFWFFELSNAPMNK